MKLYFILSVVMSLLVISCSDDSMLNSPERSAVGDAGLSTESGELTSTSDKTIVEIAAGDPNFSVLVEAVVFADLDRLLSGKRQFTVFAPTNEAFVSLLNTLGLEKEELFTDENKSLVQKILLYHVAPGERFAEDVVSSDRVRTMAREFAMVDAQESAVFIGNEQHGYAQITATDIDASNGVIHVLDGVILPPSLNLYDNGSDVDEKPEDEHPAGGNTIVDIAAGNPDFSILVEAVIFADLAETLSGKRQFTVFAPTNAAFEALLEGLGLEKEELFVEENKELVEHILLYHVAPGERFAEDVVSADRVRTMAKEFAFVKIEEEKALIGNDTYGYAQIIATDIDASNGVVHVLDAVILPPSLEL